MNCGKSVDLCPDCIKLLWSLYHGSRWPDLEKLLKMTIDVAIWMDVCAVFVYLFLLFRFFYGRVFLKPGVMYHLYFLQEFTSPKDFEI